jgi:hypothetical protein
MANSLRQDFHTDLSFTVFNDIQYRKTNYYYFLGKVEPWNLADLSPEVIELDSVYENKIIRTNIVYIKKIAPNDVSLVTTRYNWESGVVFANWDDTKNVYGTNFYCLADNNVYKCLDNNVDSPSTEKPVGKSFYTFRTSDGYLWKYMYTVPQFKRSRFMSFNQLPVQRALSDSFYNKGSIDAVIINNPGTGYTDALLTSIVVTGATTGSGAAGTVNVNAFGQITSVTISNGGTGYTAGVAVTVSSITGSLAVGTADITGGEVTDITFSNQGLYYTQGDSLSFSVGGAVIIPSVSKTTGSIVGIRIENAGTGYAVAPTLTVSGIGGTGKYGNASALLSCIVYQGSIVQVNVLDPGLDYPADNATTIVVQGDGIDAVFNPVIYNSEIIDIVVENPGSGYTYANITVVGNGTLATLTPVISSSDFNSDQSLVEQTTVPGAIYCVKVTNAGTNYTDTTVVSIVGDGTGATAHAVVSGGTITNIVVDSYGTGYTYGAVVITDPFRASYGTPIDAAAYVILPPENGHGYDAVKELFGDTLAINSFIRQDQNLNLLAQDFRQFGLLKNPKNIYTGKLYTNDSSIIIHKVEFTNTIGLVVDEILVFGTNRYRVLSFTGNIVNLQQLGIKYIIPTGVMTAETDSNRVYTSIALISSPDVNKYSGDLLYISDENPFSFSNDQGISIKTFLKF